MEETEETEGDKGGRRMPPEGTAGTEESYQGDRPRGRTETEGGTGCRDCWQRVQTREGAARKRNIVRSERHGRVPVLQWTGPDDSAGKRQVTATQLGEESHALSALQKNTKHTTSGPGCLCIPHSFPLAFLAQSPTFS